MALYNLSEFIELLKEDAELGNLPLPATDQEIINHFDKKTLVDFSMLCPYIEEVTLGESNVVKEDNQYSNQYRIYKIPKYVYEGTTILNIFDFRPYAANGLADLYVPSMGWSSPDNIIGAVANVRMAAGLASTMSKAPTIKFKSPDKIVVYNGWVNGTYVAEVGMKHPLSLATIEPGTFTIFRELALMDLKAFLYGKLKRKDNLETGVGSIDLKISDWSNVAEERKQKFEDYMNDSSLQFEHIWRW